MSSKSKGIDSFQLHERIKYLRGSRGLTQVQLAKKASLSVSTIAQIESEVKEPNISTLTKIAEALDLKVAVFFAEENTLVFDLEKLKKNYPTADSLHPTTYKALGKIVSYAKDIGFL